MTIMRLTGCACALALATAAAADPRVATRLYRASDIVVVNGRAGVESTVAFADDERIENVAVGDSAAWQVTPNRRANLLFVKPAGTASRRTNMTVVTDRRTYLFDLVAAGRTPPVYMLRFSYPPEPRPAPVAAPPVQVASAPTPPVPERADPARFNFAWAPKGDKGLIPERVFDDGRATFLAWDRDAPLPAILTRDATGDEGPVNYTTRGGYIVVDGVPRQIVLRAGKQLATLTAQTPEPSPAAPSQNLADARPSGGNAQERRP